jgi:hypothetical protein
MALTVGDTARRTRRRRVPAIYRAGSGQRVPA